MRRYTYNIGIYNIGKGFVFLLLAFFFSNAIAFGASKSDNNVYYTQKDSAEIVTLLAEAPQNMKNEDRILYFGKKLLGRPYVAHTLELPGNERLVVNMRELDCTTFLETVLALSLSNKNGQKSFESFCNNLRKLRYRSGKIDGYASRLHYFTWWADDNVSKGLVKEIVKDGSPFISSQKINVNYMTQNPDKYAQLKDNTNLTSVIRKYEVASNGKTIKYIPKRLLNGSETDLSDIHTGDIVAIVTSKSGLDTSHLGFAVWQNGKLHLMHASSLYHKVVLDSNTFYNYSNKQRSQLGIRVFRLL